MKKIVFLIGFFLFLFTCFSQSVSVYEAKEVAKNHYYHYGSIEYDAITFSDKHIIKSKNNEILYYVFNVSNNKGFVIISAYKSAYPVLGYSFVGNYSTENQPPALTEWMDFREKEMLYIKNNNISADIKISEKWAVLKNKKRGYEKKSKSVEPLISTKWSGKCYYNAMCPEDASSDEEHCGHVPAGCVSVAMAQMIKYWSQPENGIGSNSYECPPYGVLSANFAETTYNYHNMPNSIDDYNDDIATLIFHCGVAVEMKYAPERSGANLYDAHLALLNNFDFLHSEALIKNEVPDNEWKEMLIFFLDNYAPIIYGGMGEGAHAFICDGYQNTEYFHFNWGWGGDFDGYFYLNSLNPDTYDFSDDQRAVLLVGKLPSGAREISGPTEVCIGQSSVTYTVPPISRATSYIWTLPNGATGTSDTNSIEVDFSESAVSGEISVKGSRDEGEGLASYLSITVNDIPEEAGSISGELIVCQGQSSVNYSVPEILNATSYQWSLPEGATGTSSTNSIDVDFSENAVSGNISVKGVSSCGEGIESNLHINVNPKPETPTVTLDGNTLNSDATSGNQWYNMDGVIEGEVNQEFVATESGDYYVIVTIEGCSSEMSNIVSVIVSDVNISDNYKNINIYPNPVSNKLIIEKENNTDKIEFEILNTLSQVVYKGYLFNTAVVNTKIFEAGVYFIRFKDGEKFSEIKKIIKE